MKLDNFSWCRNLRRMVSPQTADPWVSYNPISNLSFRPKKNSDRTVGRSKSCLFFVEVPSGTLLLHLLFLASSGEWCFGLELGLVLLFMVLGYDTITPSRDQYLCSDSVLHGKKEKDINWDTRMAVCYP